MLKAAGALLILSGCAVWSAGGVLRLRSRKRILARLAASLDLMESEICDRQAPLPEVVRQLAGTADGPVKVFYTEVYRQLQGNDGRTFAEMWRRAILRTPDMMLTPEEEYAFSQLGFSLGKYDAAYQKNAIALTRKKMALYAKTAREECERDWKVQAFVGMAAGLAAVIVLL